MLEDYKAVRDQTLRQVERLTDGDLNDPRKFAWTDGETLAALIADGTLEHDREHIAQIFAWRASLN